MIDIKEYGFNPSMYSDGQGEIARVTAVFKERYELVSRYGQIFAHLKSSIYFNNSTEEFPNVGDFVLILYNELGDSQIIKTLPRKTIFVRKDPNPNLGQQVVASNFDYVFIMQSLNYDFNIKRIERYLTLTWQSGAIPVIVLTKADLVEDYHDQLNEIHKIAPHVDVCVISTMTNYGIEQLNEYLKPGKTIVFLGSSGVGKSSLVNTFLDKDVMLVSGIREGDSKGRHTTTHRQLFMLPSGAMIIDTPGMREIGMWDVGSGLSEAFEDVDALTKQCKFSDCHHENEPGCAVIHALENGDLDQARWKNYQKLLKEAEYAKDKAKFMQKTQQKHITITKFQKELKKNRKR